MFAKAVSTSNQKVNTPKPSQLVNASFDCINLNEIEFEDDGFGTGVKILSAGDSTEEHSTCNYREIIYCLMGTITVIKENE